LSAAFSEQPLDFFRYIFWKLQISILVACPPLLGAVSNISMNAYKSRRLWLKTLSQTALQIPRALFCYFRDKLAGRVVMSRLSIPVTTRCNLNCDKCAGHFQEYRVRADTPLCELERDIRTLLSCVDHIYAVILAGGEAFLHPDLDKIVRIFADSGKVGSINVQTNGTLLPDKKLLAAFRDAGVTVKISRYAPFLQPDVEQLKRLLKENGTQYMHTGGSFWYDSGEIGLPKEGEMPERRFSVCVQQLCLVYYEGKLHLCAESLAATKTGRIPISEEDYIDLRANEPAAFSERLRRLLKKRSVSACACCLGHTYKTPRVPVAVQRKSVVINAKKEMGQVDRQL